MVIIVQPPAIHNVSRLSQAEEQFAIEAFISKLAIEALDVAVFPGTARLYEQRANSALLKPLPHGLGGELRAVVATDVSRSPSNREQFCQRSNYIPATELPTDLNCQTLTSKLIHHVQHPQPAAAFGAITDEVIAPYVILAQWLAAMACIGAIAQSPAIASLLAYLKAFGLPESMNTLDVHTPPFLAKQNCDAAITESRPLQRKFMHRVYQLTLIVRDLPAIPLRRSRLADRPADPTL
jgi:hypothetical protein